jgi:hypothetical protein
MPLRLSFGPRLGTIVLCAAVTLPALAFGVWTTHDLVWPYDVDFQREMAQAQVFVEGGWQQEAFYLDQKVWYPPLGPAVVAVLSRLTGITVPLLYARVGAFVNFLAPVLLFLLANRALGRTAALACVFDYLYLRPSWLPGWVAGTYTPWLLSGTFAQAPFFATLFAYESALRRPSRVRSALVGFCAALAVMAHASAALLLAVILASTFCVRCWQARGERNGVVRQHLVIALTTVVFAAPYLLLLAAHYAHGVLNHVPAGWIWSGLAGWDSVPELLNWSLLLVPFGVWTLLRQRRGAGAQLALFWLAASAVLLILGFKAPLVPAHHLLAYLRAALSVAVGAGAAALIRAAERRWPAVSRQRWAVPVLTLAAVLLVLPSYPQRRDLWQGRLLSQRQAERPNQLRIYDWLREHGGPRDVVLASDELSMAVIGPAGRKVVAVPSLWASPFVDNGRRRCDRDLMFLALRDGDPRRFCDLASQYHVTHVVRARREGFDVAAGARPLLERVFDNGKITVDRLTGCASGQVEAQPRASP